MSKRPHIIIFNPDEMRADTMGHLGNPAARTPRLDAFAQQEAVSFRHAYCQNPVCVPSRCSFLTGLYPHVHGHRTMSHLLWPGESSLFSELKDAGYYVWMNDRCELNRQIKRDNALLRELKAQVKKLVQAVKNTVPALAEAMESVRENMIIFKYQLGYILTGKRRLTKSLDVLKPELEHYTRIAGQIKEKSKEHNTLLAEKKATPVLSIIKHRDISRRIAELTEELEELRSEKKQLLAMMDYAEDTGLSTVKKDVSAMESNLARLEQQERKYTAELNAALAEYSELKAQAADFDPDELSMAQLELRPQKESSAVSRVQAAYGEKYDFWTMIGAKREVSELLGEEEPRSIRERLRRKEYKKQRSWMGAVMPLFSNNSLPLFCKSGVGHCDPPQTNACVI